MAKDRNEGCFHCGGGKEYLLTSVAIKGLSIALCPDCLGIPPDQISRLPFATRQE